MFEFGVWCIFGVNEKLRNSETMDSNGNLANTNWRINLCRV